MKVCKRCLYTSYHPLYLTFDQEGVCSGCRVHEEKDTIDWSERRKKLRSIFSQYRCTSGKNYDCIVPVSGARDSYFILYMVKKVYGMNPLLVTYNKHYNTAVGVRNLANLRIRFDCDIVMNTVSPKTVKKITRGTLRRFGSIYWHCIAGQTVFPIQIAVKFKIPLIVWGAHQGIDQVGMFSHLDEVEMTRKYRKEHDLMGYEAEDLIDEFDDIKYDDVLPYVYPENREIERVGVRGIYLNNYVRWDSRMQHEQMIRDFGYESAIQTRTFDSYNDIDCWNYSNVHDYIKWLKHGYGKVVDHACREIRLGHMTRDEGTKLVKIYKNKKPKYLPHFLRWIGITKNSFHYLVDQHRNQYIWNKNQKGCWELNTNFKNYYNANSKSVRTHSDFKPSKSGASSDVTNQYILIGRGWK